MLQQLITDNIDLWTSAETSRSTAGRGSNGKTELTGIKKLRELILELAVRGLLVPQDPNDEPASVLLAKIAAEKEALIKAGKLKKQKPLPEITEDEKPFKLPDSWEWTRLGNLAADIHYGYTASADQNISNVRLLRITDIQNDAVNWHIVPGCEIENKNLPTYKLENGDLLIARTGGTIGKSYLVENIDVCSVFASYLIRIKRVENMCPKFLKSYLGSQFYWRQLYESSMGTGQPNVNGNALKNLVFTLPPLAEQHRIVAKVDELMALCDQLEQQQLQHSDTHHTLVTTLFDRLSQATDNAQFQVIWSQIAAHFDTLFTTEASIDQLKQTLLQLAVMGKLVPQDPNDEPASVLQEKIAAEKAQLIKDGKIKNQKPLPEITEDEKPFRLPDGWQWVRLENLTKIITKGSSPKWQGVSYTDNPYDILFVTSENVGSYLLKLESKKYVEHKFNEIEPRSILEKGDFLMNIVGASIGRTAVFNIDADANINQAVCLIRCFETYLNSQFFLHFFNSEICISYMYDKQVDNARPNLSMSNIAKFIIPIPPLAEQHRIVAKVDELMALCDQLKAGLNQAQTTQQQLAQALVEQAIH